MVFPEDADLGVFVPEAPAVEEEAEFHGTCYTDCDCGWEMEIFCAEGVAHWWLFGVGIVSVGAVVPGCDLHD